MAANSSNHDPKPHLIFSYGTLKRGFHNHKLMQELITQDDAVFIGPYTTRQSHPLVCGPHGIPYLINLPGSGHPINGELYAVSTPGLARLDDLEGISIGHYERLPVDLVNADKDGVVPNGVVPVEAEAYFAHRNFGQALWERNAKEGLTEFTQAVAEGYVKRQDRPHQGRHILDDVRHFVSRS